MWKALFFEGARVLMFSQGEDEAKVLLEKSKFIHSQLPDFLRLSKGRDQETVVSFEAMYSEIRALPSTERAGHGYAASLVIRDELEHHLYAEENLAAVGPAVDRVAGQMIDLSTTNRQKLSTHFKTRYREARSGKNDAYPLFLSAKERESTLKGITFDEWYAKASKKYAGWMLPQELPMSEDDALSVLHTIKYFDMDALNNMTIEKPMELPDEFPARWKGTVRIYKRPVIGRLYAIYADPSMGKEDPHAVIVRDTNGDWVAISHGWFPADEVAMVYDALVKYYNNAWNSYEANAQAGGVFKAKIDDMHTPNQCPTIDNNGILKKGQTGQWASQRAVINKRLGLLEENIRLGVDRIYDKEAIEELGNFIVPEGKDPQHPEGGHDDIISAAAGVTLISRYVKKPGGVQVMSFKYNEG